MAGWVPSSGASAREAAQHLHLLLNANTPPRTHTATEKPAVRRLLLLIQQHGPRQAQPLQ